MGTFNLRNAAQNGFRGSEQVNLDHPAREVIKNQNWFEIPYNI
jgi:hypothetical protein